MNIKRIIIFSLSVLIFTMVFSFVIIPLDSTQAQTLQNPLGENNLDPRIIIGNVVRVMLGLVGSLALAVFVYGGFNWVTSAGNEEKIKKGKDMIMWASLGLAVVFLSYVLVRFVIEAVTGSGEQVTGGTSATERVTGGEDAIGD